MNENPSDELSESAQGAAGSAPAPELTSMGKQYLIQTQPWVRLLSILHFAGAGLMVIFSFVILVAATMGRMEPGELGGIGRAANTLGTVALAVVYMALAGLYIPPGLFLLRYAGAIKILRTGGTSGDLEAALKHQRSFWRYVGILAIVGMVVAVLVIAVAILLGVFFAMRQGRA